MTRQIIHILGAGRWQVPSIIKAKKLGYHVLVTDIYKERPGYKYADYHEQIDIRNVSDTLAVSRKFQINGIVCDTTDVGVPTMAYIAKDLNLHGMSYDTAVLSTNKYLQREAFFKLGLNQPQFSLASSVQDIINFGSVFGWPVVVKPVDSQSARGVRIVNNIDEAETSYNHALSASASNTVIIETRLLGSEISVEGIVVGGVAEIVAIAEKEHFQNMPTIASRITYPAQLPNYLLTKITDTQNEAIKSLGLKDGVFHAEYMIVDDEPYVIEMAARGGGSRIYTDIIPCLYNYDIVSSYLRYIMTGQWQKESKLQNNPPHAANLIFFKFPYGVIPQRINQIKQIRNIKGVKEIEIELEMNKPIPQVDSGRSRHGYALIFGSNRDEVISIGKNIYNSLSLTIDSGDIVNGGGIIE